jgi:hypothetical protein
MHERYRPQRQRNVKFVEKRGVSFQLMKTGKEAMRIVQVIGVTELTVGDL